jgi:DNA-directed RNA polymerase subunit alpha
LRKPVARAVYDTCAQDGRADQLFVYLTQRSEIRQLNIFANMDTAELARSLERAVPEFDVAPTNGMEHILIEELELGVRSYNCLKRVGIETVGDLVAKSDRDLAAIPNFGRKSIDEIRAALGAHGLRLRGDEG